MIVSEACNMLALPLASVVNYDRKWCHNLEGHLHMMIAIQAAELSVLEL